MRLFDKINSFQGKFSYTCEEVLDFPLRVGEIYYNKNIFILNDDYTLEQWVTNIDIYQDNDTTRFVHIIKPNTPMVLLGVYCIEFVSKFFNSCYILAWLRDNEIFYDIAYDHHKEGINKVFESYNEYFLKYLEE